MQMYPAPIRATAHGISAATGKVGSILVVVWLNYLGNRNKFWITWPFALLGAVICWIFVADNTGLDLAEQVLGPSTVLHLHFSVCSLCLLCVSHVLHIAVAAAVIAWHWWLQHLRACAVYHCSYRC